MAGQLVTQPLGAFGAYGMNTQASPIDLPTQFSVLGVNCYADEAGRPTARAAAQLYSTANVDLGSNPIVRAFRHNHANASSTLLLAGGGSLYYSTDDGETLTTISAGPFGTDEWQFASLNGKAFAIKASTTGLYFTEAVWTASNLTTPGSVQFKAIHSAYGRLWAVTNTTLYWSDLLDGTNFSTGASGSLDLQRIHTQFRDVAVAVTSFAGQIVVLCRNSTYVLGLGADKNPNNTIAPIYLRDFVPNIGCVARDTVVSTGDDVVFVSDDGVRSLLRSLQESQGPAPLTDRSAANKDYTIANLVRANTSDELVASWNPERGWYFVFSPATEEVWLFDFGQKIPQVDAPRMFIWRMGTARTLYCGVWTAAEQMAFGGAAGMFDMESFDTGQSYTMTLTTGWLSLGGPERMDQFKKVMLNLTGGSGQTASLRWAVDFNPNSLRTITFNLDSDQTVYEFNVAEFEAAEFSSGQATVELYLNIGGNGKVIQLTLEIPIEGNSITLNNSLMQFKQGRIR